MERKHKEIGVIELGEDVIVSDPSYEPNLWCNKHLKVKPGKYTVDLWEPDNSFEGNILVITHESYPGLTIPRDLVNSVQLGIDSGQVGIYDLRDYQNNDVLDQLEKDGVLKEYPEFLYGWYAYACTNGSSNTKLVGRGVTCASGYGDGVATLHYKENGQGEIVRIAVNFGDEDEL